MVASQMYRHLTVKMKCRQLDRTIRHHAVVVVSDEKEAVELAERAHGADDDKIDPRVLFGSAGDWEDPEAIGAQTSEGIRDQRRITPELILILAPKFQHTHHG